MTQWFYAANGQQFGPVAQEEFDQLVQQGVVKPDTLVWREGMSEWQAFGTSAQSPPPPEVASPAVLEVNCARCGRRLPSSEVIPLANRLYCATCKPLAIQQLQEGVSLSPEAERIRQEYLKHEASVRSVGVLYYLGGAFLTVMGCVAVAAGAGGGALGLSGVGIGAIYLLLGVAQIWTGSGLRRLKSWARLPTGILSGLGLLAIPIGTLINAYILYLLFSQKGKMIFSEEYRDVVAQTPHIKYRTSILVWILLGLVIVGLLAAILLPLLARARRG